MLELDRPFLTDGELAALKADPELNTVTLSTLVPIVVGAELASAQGEGKPRPYMDLDARSSACAIGRSVKSAKARRCWC